MPLQAPAAKPMSSAAGEMLNSIAQRYGVDLDALKSVNDLRSHVIHPGDVLQLPGPTPAEMPAPTIAQPAEIAEPEPPAPTLRIVRWGDTLGEIAAAHGLSLRELMRLNDLVSTIIVPGMELKLPGNSGVEPSPAAPNPAPHPRRQKRCLYRARRRFAECDRGRSWLDPGGLDARQRHLLSASHPGRPAAAHARP